MFHAMVRCTLLLVTALTVFAGPAFSADARALLRQASAALDAGRLEEALTLYAQAEEAAISPVGRAAAANGAGFALLRRHKPADAVPHLQRAVAADPANRFAWNNLGAASLALYEGGRADRTELTKALAAFRKAAELDPASGNPNLPVATEYDRQETAIAAAAAARKDKPAKTPAASGSAKAYNAAGAAAEAELDFDLALANYAKAEGVSGKKGKANAANLSGLLELRRHRPEQALAHLRRATEADPANRYAWNNRGSAARALFSSGGDPALLDEAATSFRKVGEIDPAYRPENREWADRELAMAGRPATASAGEAVSPGTPAAESAPVNPAEPAKPATPAPGGAAQPVAVPASAAAPSQGALNR